MTDLPPSHRLVRQAPATPCYDLVVLPHHERALRVRALATVHDETFIVDLPERTDLSGYFGFELEDGRVIQIIHAEEELLEVQGDLTRFAWHLGALNMVVQIEKNRLLVHRTEVAETLLKQLGARFRPVSEPFWPEPPVHIAHHHHHTHAEAATPAATAPEPDQPSGGPF